MPDGLGEFGTTANLQALGHSKIDQSFRTSESLVHFVQNQKISVRSIPGFKHSIYKSELSNWFMVQNKQCSPKHAEEIFNLFF